MIIAYHAVFTTYGTWLPNDPRGSFSMRVYNDALRALRPISIGRQDPQPDMPALRAFWTASLPMLKRKPYFIDESTRPIVAAGFESIVRKFALTVTSCAIMNDHVHIVLAASEYRIEYLVGQLKAAATRLLCLDQTPWAQHCWKVYLNDEDALAAANEYVRMNPIVAGLGEQNWAFVVSGV